QAGPARAAARGDGPALRGRPPRGGGQAVPRAGLPLRDARSAGIPERQRQRGAQVDREKVKELLEAVASGALRPEQAMARLRDLPVDDLGFARVDLHRSLRHGVPEAVFCQGKTPAQVVAIASRLPPGHANVLSTTPPPARV